jgi:hypothetical protein
VGWFRAVLEAALMGWSEQRRQPLHRELAKAREVAPEREAILSLVGMLSQNEIHESKHLVSSVLWRIDPWLQRGAELGWPGAEFQTLAACFHHLGALDILRNYAAAALRREPEDIAARFYRIVAQTKGEADLLRDAQEDELSDLIGRALDAEDFHTANRIRRFLNCRTPEHDEASDNGIDDETVEAMLDEAANGSPLFPIKDIRRLVNQLGQAGAVEALTEIIGASPLGGVLSEAQVAQVCAAVVARATATQAARR